MHQRELNGLRAFVEVNGISLIAPQYIECCATLSDALWRAKAPLHSGRKWTQQDLADALDMSQGALNRFMNGTRNPSADFLLAYCRVVRNLLPIQWFALQMGTELHPAKQGRIQQLERELAELKATG